MEGPLYIHEVCGAMAIGIGAEGARMVEMREMRLLSEQEWQYCNTSFSVVAV